MPPFESIVDAIGNTPIVKLARYGSALKHNLLGKCEFLNPGGSVKDRIARHMIDRAEKDGRLKPGGTMVEATAGNTGLGLAMVAAVRGYKLITVVSAKVSPDKVRLLKRLGAEVVVCASGKPLDDPEHILNKTKSIAESCGGWLVNQFFNEDNVAAHYAVTGPEIWEQTEGQIDAIVAGVGTGGTLSGAGRYLKEKKPSIKVVLADPNGSILAGIVRGCDSVSGSYIVEGIGQDFVPGNFHSDLVDAAISISDSESVEAAYDLMRMEGVFAGSSSGCIAAAAYKYCAENLASESERKNVLAILPDGGRGYLSTIYDDAWLTEKLPATAAALV